MVFSWQTMETGTHVVNVVTPNGKVKKVKNNYSVKDNYKQGVFF